MKKLLLTIITFLTISSANAQTRMEMNAEDLACVWTDSKGRTDTDICHITAQGTIMGETLMSFRIGDRVPQYVISDQGYAMLVIGSNENQKILWKGKATSTYINNHKNSTTEVVKISDGMTVKLFRKWH